MIKIHVIKFICPHFCLTAEGKVHNRTKLGKKPRPQSCNIRFDVTVNRKKLRGFFFIMKVYNEWQYVN